MADPQSYPAATIAKLLNITERRLQQLAKDGIVPKSERGRYPLVESVRGYVKFLQDRSAGRQAAPIDQHAEKLRLTRAQADKAELEASELAGSLVRVDEVEAQWSAVLGSVRARLLAMPSKVGPRARAAATDQAAAGEIEAEVLEALQELSNGSSESSRDGEGDLAPRASGAGAAAEADRQPVGGPVPAPVERKQRRTRAVAH